VDLKGKGCECEVVWIKWKIVSFE